MGRDADDTRRRLLEAAVTEFAERGIAGARVDRIAAAASANKALIYSYFGNKEELFDAVFHALVVDTVQDVPIDADDLPGYAARLFDRTQEQPHALRIALWHSLERGSATMPEAVVAANRQKAEAIAAAQRAGRISARFAPEELLAVVVGLSVLGSPDLALTHPSGRDGLAERRRTVVESVRILTAKDGK